jgi:hypothetical protein
MKKFIFAVSMILAFQSMTFAAPAGLKAAYEEYLYATTVEWDQVDADQIASINARFADELADLQEEGLLTKAHLKEFFAAEVSSGRVPQEVLKEVLSPAGELTVSTLSQVLNTYQYALQDRGAGWNGTGKKIFTVVAWGFLPALIIIGVITHSGRKEMCTETAGRGYGFHEPFACN